MSFLQDLQNATAHLNREGEAPTERNTAGQLRIGDGSYISVGSRVGFKNGYEQYGIVTAINGSSVTIDYWDDEEQEDAVMREEAHYLFAP